MKYTTEGTLTGTDQTVEPVSRSEAKAWLRIDSGTADDALIDALIVSSRQQAEKYTGRAFIERNFSLNLDACDVKPGFPIKLTRAPLTGVSAFQYRGSAGTYENWGTSNYLVDLPGARLVEGVSGSYPAYSLPEEAAYRIPFTAGYGTAGTNVPELIRTAIKTQVLIDYENRGGQEKSDGSLHPAVRAMLNPFRMDLI